MFNDIRVIAAGRTLAVLLAALAGALGVHLLVFYGGIAALGAVCIALLLGMLVYTVYDIMLVKVMQERELKAFEKQLNSKS
jgi:Flp pilus assembly protein TadB